MRRFTPAGAFALVGGALVLLLIGLGVAVAFQRGALSAPTPLLPSPGRGTPSPTLADGVYREALVGTPTMLDPLLASSQPDRDLSALIFSGLTKTDGHGGNQPDLAASWKIEDGGKRYVFTLRQGVTWQDGQPFTSRDVLFTIRLLQDPAFPGDGALADLWRTVDVQTPDDHTVVCTLPNVYAPFLAYTTIGILPAHLLADVKAGDLPNEAFNLKPVGTGPFAFAGLDTDKVEITLRRNDHYYGQRPHLRELHFRFYPSTPDALRGVQSGAVDGIGYIPQEYLPDAASIADTANIYGPSIAGYTALFFNLKAPVFAPREVRQALALAVNRDELIKQALGGWATAGSSPILPTSWAYTTQGVTQYPFDPERAKQTLDQAGWKPGPDGVRAKGGQALAFTLVTSNDPARVAVANLLAQQFGAIGCKVAVQAVAPDQAAQQLAQRRFEAALFGWEGLASDPDPYQMWHSSQADSGYNFSGYSNPTVDDALAQARQTTDQAKRAQDYATFLKTFSEDVPSLILYYPQYHFAVSKRVSGVSLDPLDEPSDRFRTIADWTIQK